MELYNFTTANQTITCNTYFLTIPKEHREDVVHEWQEKALNQKRHHLKY